MPRTSSPPSPAARGFRMPAEWEPHEATIIAWPHNVEDWPGRFQPIPWVFADIVRKLAEFECVRILVNNEALETKARRILRRVGADLNAVTFHRVPTNRIWTRDTGPIFVVREKGKHRERLALNWKFNAWAKYPDWQQDNEVPHLLSRDLHVPSEEPHCGAHRVVLEGGSIDVNGRGLLLTTEECLLSSVQERNPGLSRPDYEKVFAEYLGIDKTLWLRNGIAGDDTHGHVDDLARFVAPNVVVIVSEDDPADANYEPLRENLRLLQEATDQFGKPLRVVPLPMPAPVVFDGQRLPASYANFYIANKAVLVPTFNDACDRIALNILQDLFPAHRVVGVHCLDFIWGLGAIHCMTQQEPAA